jgi:hypothetical protein
MSKKIVILVIAILGVCILLVGVIGYLVYKNYYMPSTATLPPPPQTYDFPSEQIRYPAEWPNDLKFPEQFVLVDSASGSLPESTSIGWSVRLIYQGNTDATVKALSEFLGSKDWTITDNLSVDSNNVSILIEREGSSGIIAISSDPNNPSQTLITATFFP